MSEKAYCSVCEWLGEIYESKSDFIDDIECAECENCNGTGEVIEDESMA